MSTVVIISDTHENEKAMQKAVTKIKKINPALVIHLGDIISPPVLENFEGLPMRFIYGNNDGEKAGLLKACEKRGWEISDTFETTIDNKKIFCAHGHRDDWRVAIKEQKYDYVFSGHTHVKLDETTGKTRHINPGALFRVREGNYTFAKLDVKTGKLEFIDV